jgi:hypothetical protein
MVAAIAALPWVGIDLAINQPAGAIARFFADSFERRIGKPLPIVAGDLRAAALIGLGAPSRPQVYFTAAPSALAVGCVARPDRKRRHRGVAHE